MSDTTIIVLVFGLFALLLAAGAYIHSVLFVAGIAGIVLLHDASLMGNLIGPASFQRTATYTLTTIPLFVLMAQFVLQSGVIKDMFYLVNRASGGRRGFLGSLTFVAGALLGAVSGSGTAAAASIGQVAAPELERHQFKPAFAGGIAAAAGSLSGIIPPSIILILYGVATETPIGDLFIAAIVPGLLVMVVFIVIMMAYLHRTRARLDAMVTERALPEKIGARRIFVSMAVSGFIVVVVFGGIYSGLTTPTEAGAVGALAALFAALVLGKVSVAFMRTAMLETVKVTVMVMLIMIGAQIFGRFVSLSLLPRRLIDTLGPLTERPVLLLTILALVLFFLFMIIEGAAVILMTIPVMLPLVQAMEVDLVWFGVFVAVVCTVGLITPPVGLNVFSVSGATGIASGPMFRYTTVFAAGAAIVVCGLLVAVPELALWLPSRAG